MFTTNNTSDEFMFGGSGVKVTVATNRKLPSLLYWPNVLKTVTWILTDVSVGLTIFHDVSYALFWNYPWLFLRVGPTTFSLIWLTFQPAIILALFTVKCATPESFMERPVLDNFVRPKSQLEVLVNIDYWLSTEWNNSLKFCFDFNSIDGMLFVK